MTAGQVSDLMGGRPGPVPMDLANEAMQLRAVGWTADQIADVLGDKLQRRLSNPLGAAMQATMMNSLQGMLFLLTLIGLSSNITDVSIVDQCTLLALNTSNTIQNVVCVSMLVTTVLPEFT